MADDVHRWSDELARDPSSLVFLQLGEALRRQGQLEIALKIALRGLERHPMHPEAHDLVARIAVDRSDFARAAGEWETVLRLDPEHLGAMKGLGYLSFHQGRFDVAEQYLERAAAEGAGRDVSNALANVRRSSGVSRVSDPQLQAPRDLPPELPPAARRESPPETAPESPPPALRPTVADPELLFADLLLDDGQTALLLDGSGYVVGGLYLDADGNDIGQSVGAHLSGISDEVRRSTKHLDLGDWRSMVFETQAAVLAMAPAADDSLVVVAASRATPLGLLRRLLDRCAERAGPMARRGGA
jgi:tetratricopeptide (TPR) repeat protein